MFVYSLGESVDFWRIDRQVMFLPHRPLLYYGINRCQDRDKHKWHATKRAILKIGRTRKEAIYHQAPGHLLGLRRSNGARSCHTLLSKLALVQAHRHDRLGLLHLLRGRSKEDLDVARVAAVRVDTTVSTIGAAVSRRSLLNNNVADNQCLSVHILCLSVRLSILQQVTQKLDRLDRPATLRRTQVVYLRSTTDTTIKAAEGNSLLVLEHIVKVFISLLERHASHSGSGLTRVLEVNTEVGATRLGRRLRNLGVVECVADLFRLATTPMSKIIEQTSIAPSYNIKVYLLQVQGWSRASHVDLNCTYHPGSDEVVERWNTAGYVSPTSGLAEDCYLQTSRKYHVPFVVSDIAMWCHVVFRVEHGPVNADAV